MSQLPPQPEWTEIDGVKVLRIGDSKFVAVPTTNRKDAKNCDILNLESLEHVCTLERIEAMTWLIRANQ